MTQQYKFVVTALELTKSHVVVSANDLAEATQKAEKFQFDSIQHQVVGGHNITDSGKRTDDERVVTAAISDIDKPGNYPLYILDSDDPIIQTCDADSAGLKDKYESELVEYFTAGNKTGKFNNSAKNRTVLITSDQYDLNLIHHAILFAANHDPQSY